MPSRLLFIDNIRWSIIILVLSMRASDTYSPFGNWYYTDRPPLSLGNAFAVYLFHPPIIIACALVLHAVALPGPGIAALLTMHAAITAFGASALVFRRIPYLRSLL
jgi:hypothetical protein